MRKRSARRSTHGMRRATTYLYTCSFHTGRRKRSASSGPVRLFRLVLAGPRRQGISLFNPSITRKSKTVSCASNAPRVQTVRQNRPTEHAPWIWVLAKTITGQTNEGLSAGVVDPPVIIRQAGSLADAVLYFESG